MIVYLTSFNAAIENSFSSYRFEATFSKPESIIDLTGGFKSYHFAGKQNNGLRKEERDRNRRIRWALSTLALSS